MTNKTDKDDKISLVNSKRIIKKWKELNLKPKEIKFLAEYINNDFNGAQAYLKTIARKGTCYASAAVEATQTLKKLNIKKAITIWMEEFLSHNKEKLETKIVRHLMVRAFYDPDDYYDEEGEIKKLNQLTREQRMAIDDVEKKYFGKDAIAVVKYKLADKDKARQELEKYIDMIKEKYSIDVEVDEESRLGDLIDIAIRNYTKDKQSKTE